MRGGGARGPDEAGRCVARGVVRAMRGFGPGGWLPCAWGVGCGMWCIFSAFSARWHGRRAFVGVRRASRGASLSLTSGRGLIFRREGRKGEGALAPPGAKVVPVADGRRLRSAGHGSIMFARLWSVVAYADGGPARGLAATGQRQRQQ